MWPFTNNKIKELEHRISMLEAAVFPKLFVDNDMSEDVAVTPVKQKYDMTKRNKKGKKRKGVDAIQALRNKRRYARWYYYNVWKKNHPEGKHAYDLKRAAENKARKEYEHKYPTGYQPVSSLEQTIKMAQQPQQTDERV